MWSDKIVVHIPLLIAQNLNLEQKIMPKNRTINIVSAGRFVEKKGFIYAIRPLHS